MRINRTAKVAWVVVALAVTSAAAAWAGVSVPRFDADRGMTEPKAVEKVSPKYPEDARRQKVVGKVVVDTVIDTLGEVVWASAVEDPDYRLAEAAVDAIEQWRFEPATDADGKPIAVRYFITIQFRLE